MAKNKVAVTFTIDAEQNAWLEEMAKKQGLPDASKALRVVLDFARTEGDIDRIFGEIRCLGCG